MLRSDIRLRRVILRCAQFRANIISLPRRGNITVPQAQYHCRRRRQYHLKNAINTTHFHRNQTCPGIFFRCSGTSASLIDFHAPKAHINDLLLPLHRGGGLGGADIIRPRTGRRSAPVGGYLPIRVPPQGGISRSRRWRLTSGRDASMVAAKDGGRRAKTLLPCALPAFSGG